MVVVGVGVEGRGMLCVVVDLIVVLTTGWHCLFVHLLLVMCNNRDTIANVVCAFVIACRHHL